MSEREQPSLDDALMQRISKALDRGGVDAEPELRELLDRDPDALRYAQDLARIDEVLASFSREVREPDWDALAARIDARLDREMDEELDELEGLAAPPRFLDEPEVSREVAVAGRSAPVVDLAARRSGDERRKALFAWSGGLAAAAAVGLAVVMGTTSFDAAPESAVSSAPMQERQALAPAEVAEEAPLWDSSEQAEAEASALPAAAAAQPVVTGARAEGAPPPPPALARAAASDDARFAMRQGRRRAARGGGGEAMLAEPESRPSRAETSLASIEPSVQRCLSRVGQVARVTLEVGASGVIEHVRVHPPYEGSDARCIERTLRTVRLAPSPEGYTREHAFRPASPAGGSPSRPWPAARARRARPASAPPAQRADTPAGSEVVDAFSE